MNEEDSAERVSRCSAKPSGLQECQANLSSGEFPKSAFASALAEE